VLALKLEGMVGKRANSTYQAGTRSPDWVKLKRASYLHSMAIGTPGEVCDTETGSARLLASLLHRGFGQALRRASIRTPARQWCLMLHIIRKGLLNALL
jgi:hypothetical protein